jgi:hypothetical protein
MERKQQTTRSNQTAYHLGDAVDALRALATEGRERGRRRARGGGGEKGELGLEEEVPETGGWILYMWRW